MIISTHLINGGSLNSDNREKSFDEMIENLIRKTKHIFDDYNL